MSSTTNKHLRRRAVVKAGTVLALAAGSACGGTGDTATAAVIDPGDGGTYRPAIDPAEFVDRIDNPYLPLGVGARWVYVGTSDGETERVEVEVLEERKVVAGISATVVRDRVFVAGELVEDTFDWFARDRAGTVWYLGESVRDYEKGRVVSHPLSTIGSKFSRTTPRSLEWRVLGGALSASPIGRLTACRGASIGSVRGLRHCQGRGRIAVVESFC